MEFTALGAEMAQLAGRFGSVDPAAAGRAELEWSVQTARRLRGMIDAREALVTCHLEALIRRGAGPDEPEAAEATAGSTGEPEPELGETSCSDEATDSSGADDAGAADRPADAAAGGHRETAAEYGARLRRGTWLRRLPSFAAALELGAITTAHVDALGAVLNEVEVTVVAEVLADEAGLLEVARTVTRASFARYLRLRVDSVRADGGAARLKRQIDDSYGSLGHDDDLGLHRMFVQLDPLRGEQVYTAIRRRVDQLQQSGACERMRRGQLIAQAVTDLICGNVAAAPGGADVLVIVDVLTLLRGHHDASICETGDGHSVPVETVRALCRQAGATLTAAVPGPGGATVAVGQHVRPDHGWAPTARGADTTATADLAAMVVAASDDATGSKLQMGRAIRLANRHQRRALRAMYRSCAHPGCRVVFADCFIHHVTPWERGGPTDLDNLLPLCGRHHHQIHDGRWRLTIDTARTLTWYQPGGILDAEVRFERLGATYRGRAAGAPGSTEPRVDPAPTDVAANELDHARDTARTATTNAWSRSRGARGSPPGGSIDDRLRLFDPTAA